MNRMKIAEIIVDNKCKETDRIFSYAIPEDLTVEIGHRVIVPFGRGNKKIAGYVIGFTDTIEFNKEKLKSIIKLAEPEPLIYKNMIEMVKWMREKYLCYYIEAIHALLPANVRIKTTYYYETIGNSDEKELLEQGNTELLLDILEFIDSNGGKASKEELRDNFNDNFLENSLRKLIKLKMLKRTQSIKKTESKKYERLLYINSHAGDKVKIPANAKKQQMALEIINNSPGISIPTIKKEFNISTSVINSLLDKDLIIIEEKEVYRLVQEEIPAEPVHNLTLEQLKAIDSISDSFSRDNHVLLHGVTGSGKTEIYLKLIEKELNLGRQGIVLVPEISLTPQMIRRFVGRFGDTVAVIHSGLSDGEKYDEWRRIRQGKAKVAVGARSAIFAPFNNLGVIIIDEEHEHTYKSEIRPKYDAREVAKKRCEIEGCKLLLGSATPTIESYYRAQKGLLDYNLVSLQKRVNQKPMPTIDIVDMREELKKGNKSIFSENLKSDILNTINENNQIILFLNRRGYSTFVSCRNCGYVVKCPNCNISLTYHAKGNYLSCHYCGYSRINPKTCPNCNSNYIRYFGIGTQKVEREFQNNFGILNVLRMDADTTARKNSHKIILDDFRNRKSDVLIGTQMIGKGHDFPDVTLVGIITSDTYLNMPDFRAAEKTFQMITQAAGRAGRGDKTGRVIVQTYSPEHYSLLHAKYHDYVGFYNEEIKLRKEMNYPPFSHIGNIIISGFNEKTVERVAKDAGKTLLVIVKEIRNVEIWGPASAPLSKIKNKYRWQIVLKTEKENQLIEIMTKFNNSKICSNNNISIAIDINPLNML